MGESKQSLSDSLLEFSVASADKALVLYGGHDLKSRNISGNSIKNSDSKNSTLKKIKIKLFVPKGFLKNIDMDSFRIENSGKILNSVVNSGGRNSLKSIAEEARKQLLENRQTVVPIMGKTALLAKHKKWTKDAEIVTKIVMEKFKKSLSRSKRTVMSNTEIALEDKGNRESDSETNLENKVLLCKSENANDYLPSSESPQEKSVIEEQICQQHYVLNNQRFNEAHVEKDLFVDEHSIDCKVEEKEGKMATHERRKLEEPEYDVEKFLEDALGEEMTKYSITESLEPCKPINETSSSNYPLTEEDSSINTEQISYLVSKESSVYSFFSKKLHHQRNVHTSSPVLFEKSELENNPLDNKASTLMNEAAVQHQIIVQTCKALHICLSSKEFRSSPEYVEAEKILLLAMLKRDAIKKELIKIDYESTDEDDFKYLGGVKISNLVFPSERELHPSNEFSRWFLVIAECGTTVLASEVSAANENGEIRFQKSFMFENLDSDFQITISIYALDVRNDTKSMSHESKYHIKEETTKCPTPNKIFHRASCSHPRYYSYERRDPSFVLWGSTTIRIADLSKPAPFRLHQAFNSSTLKGTMTANLSSRVELNETYSGFLTIGSEAGGCASWNRRWCYLEAHKLYYWNYPTDQEQSEPIGIIDLSYSVTSSISQVDRELCARPRTIIVETGKVSSPQDKDSLMVLSDSSYTITRHYLQADNYEEMVIWKRRLNSIVSALRNWNCMMCQIYFYKSK